MLNKTLISETKAHIQLYHPLDGSLTNGPSSFLLLPGSAHCNQRFVIRTDPKNVWWLNGWVVFFSPPGKLMMTLENHQFFLWENHQFYRKIVFFYRKIIIFYRRYIFKWFVFPLSCYSFQGCNGVGWETGWWLMKDYWKGIDEILPLWDLMQVGGGMISLKGQSVRLE